MKEEKNEKKILFTSLNQDFKCFLIGTREGCTVYHSFQFKKGFEFTFNYYIINVNNCYKISKIRLEPKFR